MKIFYVGVDATTIAMLAAHNILAETSDVADVEDLLDWVADDRYDAVLLNFDAASWGPFCVRFLRDKRIQTPVIGLATDDKFSWTARRSDFLDQGGDDLMRNPANPREVCSVIQAVCRRARGHTIDVRKFTSRSGAVVRVNMTSSVVTVNEQGVYLTNKERAMLMTLARHSGHTLSKEALLQHMYVPPEDEPELKIIDVFACKIRRALNKHASDAGSVIRTAWGRGYVLDSVPVDAEQSARRTAA